MSTPQDEAERETKTFYICAVDWSHELGYVPAAFFVSLESLKSNMPCWDTCGVMKVEMTATWEVEENFDKLLLPVQEENN